MTNTIAVLPIKQFELAKQRLSENFDQKLRRKLAKAMFTDVLDQLSRVPSINRVVVVTSDKRATALSLTAGAEVVHDPDEQGQSHAVQLGIRRALELKAQRVLLISGDCPVVNEHEVSDLLTTATQSAGTENTQRPQVTIVSDRHGDGTNALILDPPTIIPPAFGNGSFARHVALARSAGASVAVVRMRSLEIDLDTPDDIWALRSALAQRDHNLAPRTRHLLTQLQPTAVAHAA